MAGACHATKFVIVYSSTMSEICPELSGSDRILDPIKHTAAQEITGMNGGGQDRRFGNPLVAGSRESCVPGSETRHSGTSPICCTMSAIQVALAAFAAAGVATRVLRPTTPGTAAAYFSTSRRESGIQPSTHTGPASAHPNPPDDGGLVIRDEPSWDCWRISVVVYAAGWAPCCWRSEVGIQSKRDEHRWLSSTVWFCLEALHPIHPAASKNPPRRPPQPLRGPPATTGRHQRKEAHHEHDP
jgi:hypothetical protein